FLDGGAKGVLNLADTVTENVGEAKEDGQLDAARLQLVGQFLKVDRLVFALRRVDGNVAGGVDAEVAFAPVANAVGFHGILDLPLFDHFHQGRASCCKGT